MASLFRDIAPNARRRPRSDRLILRRLLDRERRDLRLDGDQLSHAHEIIVKWADLESSGRLAETHEAQLQGDFLRDVFGDALGYVRKTEGTATWELEQHRSFGTSVPDAVIGHYRSGGGGDTVAVIELKGPSVHLDRDRSAGRTAVQQCWDYLAALPEARWGIVSNIVSFRLYERSRTPRNYEHFALQDLRDLDEFRKFFALFHPRGLLRAVAGQPPLAERLLTETNNRQKDVGDELYESYRKERLRLIEHLNTEHHLCVDEAIAAAQQLMDRVVFIAFCEDRDLLPGETLARAHRDLPPFTKATNPRWRNYLDLFRAVDSGAGDISAYNGGLFAPCAIDELDLDDRWTNFFPEIGRYDFRDEINLDVLGHLFEKSVTELEKLREGDLFADTAADAERFAQMPQAARRRRFGIYYTPPDFTSLITRLGVDDLLADRFRDAAAALNLPSDDFDTPGFWRACLDILLSFKVCDPACGSGAFLFQAYEVLESRYAEVIDNLEKHGEETKDLAERIPELILSRNLYGVDLTPEAVEITQLALWIRSARRGKTLADLSHNIRCGNSLVSDPEVHERAFDWREEFPEVFDRESPGFDAVIGNPPWERIKLQEREFFSLSAPEIATAPNAATRRRLIARLEADNPDLYARYQEARRQAETLLRYARRGGEYPLTGRGDINTYAVFAELASRLVSPEGRVGLLVPSGIASDRTTREFFGMLSSSGRLRVLYDFENRRKLFADVDGRFKFSVLVFGGSDATVADAEFAFFAHGVDELKREDRRITLSGRDIALLNPNTGTCPIFRTRRDAELTKEVYRNVPVLIDRRSEQPRNPWGVKFLRMFDQTNDAEAFLDADRLREEGWRREGHLWRRRREGCVPLYEAKMVQMYDHRAASVVLTESNWVRQGQTEATTPVEHQNPDFFPEPRYWVHATSVADRLPRQCPAIIGFKDITSPTNQRTTIASALPPFGFTNHCVLVLTEQPPVLETCLLANLNTFVFDYVTRQKIGGVTLNFFIVEQLPTLPPHRYEEPCPWRAGVTLADWIGERVLRLSCTSSHMLPLAEAAGFTSGNMAGGRLHRWNPRERLELMAELDAAYFLLYRIEREDAEYVLSTFRGTDQAGDDLHGAATTAERILRAYDSLRASIG